MGNAKQFLIVGGNFINKGAEAMLKTVRNEIVKRHPDAQVYAICHPEEQQIALQQHIQPVFDTRSARSRKIASLVSRVFNKIERIFGGEAKPYADYSPMDTIRGLSSLYLAVDVSGFAYGDKRGYIQPLETIKIMDYCKQVGARYVFMPQAWGDFQHPKVAQNCKTMIQRADAYFTRDTVSQKYVAALLNKPVDKVPLLPDIALHFPIPELDGLTLLKKFGFTPSEGRSAICLSPNMRVYERSSGEGLNNGYIKTFLTIIQHLQQDYDLILIPNEIFPPGKEGKDDQFLCKLIFDMAGSKEHLYCVSGYHSAEEIKSIIRVCSIVVASRFHSLVFALSLGIPSLAISWSHKYRELFKLFSLEGYVMEDTGLNNEEIMLKIDELLRTRTATSEHILEVLPKLKNENAPVFDLLN